MARSTITIHDLKFQASQRAKTYDLLATLYIRPPDKEIVNALRKFHISLDDRRYAGVLPQQLVDGLRAMGAFLRTSGKNALEKVSEMFSVEFTSLFRGVKGGESPPPPYESVYREGLCWGESTVKVLEEYRRFGLTLGKEHEGEPPDHISFELAFMGFLCEREAEALRNGDRGEALRLLDAEERFLGEHLLKWVNEFSENIRRYDRLGFYRGWADVTEGWISLDHRHIVGFMEGFSRREHEPPRGD